jgi:hypothetical protein
MMQPTHWVRDSAQAAAEAWWANLSSVFDQVVLARMCQEGVARDRVTVSVWALECSFLRPIARKKLCRL